MHSLFFTVHFFVTTIIVLTVDAGAYRPFDFTVGLQSRSVITFCDNVLPL